MIKSLQSILWAATVCLLPTQMYAGGISVYEISTPEMRLASAGWSARAEDPSTVFTNPAGMTRFCHSCVQTGAQVGFAHIDFKPNSDTDVDGHDGDADIWQPSTNSFYIVPYNDCVSFGLASVGYFGADLKYNHHWVGRYYVQKLLLEGISLVPAAAYKVNDQWSIGVGANVMYGILKQRAAVRNIFAEESTPGSYSSSGFGDGYLNFHNYRFGVGALVGILYQPTCYTRYGVQYLSPVKINFHAKPKFHNINSVLEESLEDLGIIGSHLKLHVNVPQSVMFSAYHQLNDCWAIMGNIGWQQWSKFQWATVSLADLDSDEFKFRNHYKDTWHVAFGAEWYYSDTLTISGGLAYDSTAVSNHERTLDFPVGEQWRFGTGFRWEILKNIEFDFCTELQWSGDLKCAQDRGPLAGEVDGEFKDMYIIYVSTDIIYCF